MRNKEYDIDEVADKAMNLFWYKGFAATSIQDLVEATGLSRSSLYSSFDGKEDLYQQALNRYQLLTKSNIDLLSTEGSTKGIIRKLLMSILESELNDSNHRGCFMANASLELASHDERIANSVIYNFERLKKALEDLIDRGQRSGEVSNDKNSSALAIFFVNTIQGMRVLSKGSCEGNRRKNLLDVIETSLNLLN
jgi:TetR/AcrR family transcriptional regulator, transcriptional repressor for nem operon